MHVYYYFPLIFLYPNPLHCYRISAFLHSTSAETSFAQLHLREPAIATLDSASTGASSLKHFAGQFSCHLERQQRFIPGFPGGRY